MKTKYIKVSTADRLPDRSGDFLTNIGWLYFNPDSKEWGFHYPSPLPVYWLYEVPDHEEEMRQVMEELLKDFSTINEDINDFKNYYSAKIEQLLNKQKQQS